MSKYNGASVSVCRHDEFVTSYNHKFGYELADIRMCVICHRIEELVDIGNGMKRWKGVTYSLAKTIRPDLRELLVEVKLDKLGL